MIKRRDKIAKWFMRVREYKAVRQDKEIFTPFHQQMIAKKKRRAENGSGEGGCEDGSRTGMTKEEEEAKLRQLFSAEDYEETRCGLGPCTPSWLQVRSHETVVSDDIKITLAIPSES
ncbi:hypothetical protein E2C01_008510 [Portunus trituberculatus]|uniref:Uncharacterized protein n=1 Tax=Portunus trituberculatus TaxID=210409 RepID=A0A5B7D3C1_PORTR|nr:hypothetical protein [Portunus trituberculatus]